MRQQGKIGGQHKVPRVLSEQQHDAVRAAVSPRQYGA
jgi:hypothetical protein